MNDKNIKEIIEDLENECPICLEELNHDIYNDLKCKHLFHRECLKGMKSKECPMCRREMNLDEELDNIITENIEKLKQEYQFNERVYEIINRMNTIEMQVRFAIYYLKTFLDIPDFIIPRDINLDFYINNEAYDTGYYSYSIIEEICNIYNEHIISLDNNENEENEEIEEENENEENNKIFINIYPCFS